LVFEMALLKHIPRTASATAAERSRLYLLYRSKLDMILHYHPRIGIKIMTHLARILSSRLRRTSALAVTAAAAPGGSPEA
jgi:CRP-like cAMP-binding protein